MKQYLDLVKHVLDNGTRKENRTGVDTLSTFGYYYEHDLAQGFPLLTTKNVSWKNIVIEMLWFLSGKTDIGILQRHGCKFWDAWADPVSGKVPSAYGNFWRSFPVHTPREATGILQELVEHIEATHDDEEETEPQAADPAALREFARDRLREGLPPGWDIAPGSGAVVPASGKVAEPRIGHDPMGTVNWLLDWAAEVRPLLAEAPFNDQIAWVLAELQRNPMSRRMVVSAWAPGNAQTSKLPPCHAMFVLNVQNAPTGAFYNSRLVASLEGRSEPPATSYAVPVTEQRLCLHLTQRSCDVALGVPYNIASYALLLSLFSHFTGIAPGIFAHSLVDAHIYTSKADGTMAEQDHVPGLKNQITRALRPLPNLRISPELKSLADVERLMQEDISTDEIMSHFVLEGYHPHPAIPFTVAV